MREGHKYNASDFEFLDEKFKSGEWSVESGEDFDAPNGSAALSALHLQIGRGCQSDRSDLLEHRPDGADTFDTLYIGCEKFPFRKTFSINVPGVL